MLFSYDTYAIQASTYQDGKIATTYDLVITSPVEEELVVEGDPLTFETCSVVLGSNFSIITQLELYVLPLHSQWEFSSTH